MQFAFHRKIVSNYEKAEIERTENIEDRMCELEEKMIASMCLQETENMRQHELLNDALGLTVKENEEFKNTVAEEYIDFFKNRERVKQDIEEASKGIYQELVKLTTRFD